MSAIYILIVFVPSVFVVLLSKLMFRHRITMKEWCIQAGSVFVSTLLMWMILIVGGSTWAYDTEVLNGYVTSKAPVQVTCEHEHQCGETCWKDDKGKRHCKPKYCKDHAYDIDWDVRTTVGTSTIRRVDKRGLIEPPRFTQAKIGEPAANTGMGRNYMLIDPDHFHTSETIMEKYKGMLPSYPDIVDYYRINRVINDTQQDYSWINTYLNDQLRLLGKAKQLNIVVVITKNPYDYYTAIRQHWSGTKRNDVQLYYGVDADGNITWFKADSFADGQSNNVMLDMLRTPTLQAKLTPAVVEEQVGIIKDKFVRLENEQLAYLKEQWSPSIGFIVFLTLFNLIITCGITFVFWKEDAGEFEFIKRNAH